MHLTPFLNSIDPAGRFQSALLPENQREINAAVLQAHDAGHSAIAVRFCDDAGRCRHVAFYPVKEQS